MKRMACVMAMGAAAFAVSAHAGEGQITIDGSSTVFPITEAVAEEFRYQVDEDVEIEVGMSGTGGGFKVFCKGNSDISNASRPIKESEQALCAANGVTWVEFQVAIDGLTVVVNPMNDFVDYLTIEELQKIWMQGSPVRTWQDVRPEWPAEPIALYGPGVDSGTFDYFTEVVIGSEGSIRDDFSASEDDNVLVTGVGSDANALGYFGYAYYAANQGALRAVPIVPEAGEPAVAPTPETINDGTYTPLARPIFIYVNTARVRERSALAQFVQFYLENAAELSAEVGYTPAPAKVYDDALEALAELLG